LLILGCLLILVGLICFLYFDPKLFLYKLLFGVFLEIGFALVIAVSVGVLLEKTARDEYTEFAQEKSKEMSRNVFGYLYGVHLPKNSFEVLEKYVFDVPVIKTRQILNYTLPDIHEDDQIWIEMQGEYEYTVKNISDKTVPYDVKFYVSEPTEPVSEQGRNLGLQSLSIDRKNILTEDFDDLDEAGEDEIGIKRYKKPIQLLSQQEVEVRVVFTQLKRVMDNDLYQTSCVTENLTLKLRFDPEHYNVFLEPVHPQGKWDTEQKATHGDKCTTVTINAPLMPQNGAFMWWQPKVEDVQAENFEVDNKPVQEDAKLK